jgi:hypothetical protein
MNGVALRTSQTQSVMIFPAVLTDPYMIKLSILSGDAGQKKMIAFFFAFSTVLARLLRLPNLFFL